MQPAHQKYLPRRFLPESLRLLALLVLMLPALIQAQQYKYLDENGRWQFTDNPPAGARNVQELSVAGAVDSEPAETDLNKALLEKYEPAQPIEAATLAVVKIETPAGVGSGFFVSHNGFLVTNKHVVRPGKQAMSQIRAEIERGEQNLQRLRRSLKYQRQRVDYYQETARDLKAELKYYAGTELEEREREYQRARRDYLKEKKQYDTMSRKVDAAARKFNDDKNSVNRRLANASVATRFKIYFKDDRELQARLVKVSSKRDLALLKLDNYLTPSVNVGDSLPKLAQGQNVFAVGNPHGLQDYVTRGVITSLGKNDIVFDAQIHPGNSGGPLVGDDGQLLGVNTAKRYMGGSVSSEGFGIAIPVSIVKKEFPDAFEQPAYASLLEQLAPAGEPGDTAANDEDLMRQIMEQYRNPE